MKRNSQQIALPNVVSSTSTPMDVSSGRDGFLLQTIGTGGGGTYTVEGSCDEGVTWDDITSCMKDLGAADAVITPPIASNSIFEFPVRFPGMVRVKCTHVGTAGAKAYLNWQDSRTS